MQNKVQPDTDFHDSLLLEFVPEESSFRMELQFLSNSVVLPMLAVDSGHRLPPQEHVPNIF